MPSPSPLTLSPQAFAAARANFIAFYRTQGWEELADENIDVLELDGRLGEVWQGWLDRTCLVNLQAIEGPSDVNDWFLTLEPGLQKVLVEDKWALANAAYREGLSKHVNQVVVDVASAAGTSVVVQTPVLASDNEALRLRVAYLEKFLGDTAQQLQGMEGLPAENLADKVYAAAGDTQSYQPSLLLPPKMECEDGYPSDDMMEANAFNRCMETIVEMNGHLKSNFVNNASASNPFWPKLRQKAKVGNTTFSAGVSSRSVIAAAERAYEYSQNPLVESERLDRLGALLNNIHGVSAGEETESVASAEKVKALLWHELTPGDYWAFPMSKCEVEHDSCSKFATVDNVTGDLWINFEGGDQRLDDSFASYQFVPGERPLRSEVDFHPTYKITGRVIPAEDAQ